MPSTQLLTNRLGPGATGPARAVRPQRLAPHYVSHDTAPVGFAVTRPSWLAPVFLCLFAASCGALVPTLPTLIRWYAGALGVAAQLSAHDLLQDGASLSFRPFLALLIILLSIFAAGSIVQRLKLLAFSFSLYATSVLVLDFVMATATAQWVPSPFSPVGGVATGLTGLVVILVSVFTRYRLPESVRVARRLPTPRRVVLVLASCVAGAFALTTVLSYSRTRYFSDVDLGRFGGLEAEIVIFSLALVVLLFLATLLDRNVKPRHGPALSVAVLIPAFNEAHCIAETIQALDAAAERYDASCRVYVVDNGSQDGTPELASDALGKCRRLKGTVLECRAPGKSRALNFGLSQVDEDVVVRIDADTLVAPSLLREIVPWFWDPSVGGATGLPLPKPTTPRWLHPLRMIEVYYGIAFLRVAQSAADGVMVMPGPVASYRRELLRELGGFAEGINGEDADITMRIGRLGYRIVTDPTIQVYTEVPENLAQLREQRQRWARGVFHMAGRNMSTIWMRQGARGLWILPWSILNASRRVLMIPVLVGAATVEVVDPTVLALRDVSVIAGFIVVLQLIVIFALLLAHRQFRVIPFLPAYLVFRIFRAYVAFEALLTLLLKPEARKSAPPVWPPSASRRSRRPGLEPADSSLVAAATR
jgi:cellulose synthase/poly-beta-1,6-N-acetylglucosamine synthase-like glycosyltransferase